jgi:DNA-binding NarL/FixJ family response regulator
MKTKQVLSTRRPARKHSPRASRGSRPIGALQESTAALITKAALGKGRAKANLVPVFLIEDNRLLRDGLTAMLGAQGLKVIATARSGGEALQQVTRLKPQLVLLDSALGDRDSLRLVEAVKKVSPAIKVIVMHLLPAHEDVVAYVRAGVSGFIMKDASVAEFVSTIRAVADGGSVLPRLMTGTLFSHVAEQALNGGRRSVKAAMRMTAREKEVTGLIAQGLGNREIAGRLSIAAHTVKSHVHNILEKLALHTRLEVAAYAHTNGGHEDTNGGHENTNGRRETTT